MGEQGKMASKWAGVLTWPKLHAGGRANTWMTHLIKQGVGIL